MNKLIYRLLTEHLIVWSLPFHVHLSLPHAIILPVLLGNSSKSPNLMNAVNQVNILVISPWNSIHKHLHWMISSQLFVYLSNIFHSIQFIVFFLDYSENVWKFVFPWALEKYVRKKMEQPKTSVLRKWSEQLWGTRADILEKKKTLK